VTVFHVEAQHDGTSWSVRIEDDDGKLVGGTRAGSLEDVDRKARALVAGYAGIQPDGVSLAVAIQLDPALQYRLDALDELRRSEDELVRVAEHELTAAGVSPGDVEAMLSATVTNREIARVGLRRYPQAIAVRFDDRGRFATTTCRSCLETDRSSYAGLPAEGHNRLLFRGPLMCDVCFEDIS